MGLRKSIIWHILMIVAANIPKSHKLTIVSTKSKMYNEIKKNRRLQCTTDNIFYTNIREFFTAASISNIDFDIHKNKKKKH